MIPERNERLETRALEASPCFFIVGSGRSGNTLLRRLLMEQFRVYIPPETYVLGPVIEAWNKRRILGWRFAVTRSLREFERHPEFNRFPVDSLQEFEERTLSESNRRRSLYCLLDGLYRFLGKEAGVEFEAWGDKTPLNTFHLGSISETFSGSKFVYIYRDGCDVSASYVDAGIYDDLEAAALRWCGANQRMIEFQVQFPERVFEVRYEDLVDNHEALLNALAEFLEINRRPTPLTAKALERALGDVGHLAHHERVMQPIDRHSIGKGRRTLSSSDLDRLADIIDPMLLRLGYGKCLTQSERS